MGDSLTYGYGIKRDEIWTSLLKTKLNMEVINKGISGDTTAGMLSRIYYDVILNKPTYTLIMGGTNDFIWNLRIEEVEANLAAMAFQIMQNNIIPIFGLSIPICKDAAKKNWGFIGQFDNINECLIKLNGWIKIFSKNYNIKVIDFYSIFCKGGGKVYDEYYIDGLHLNKYGHKKMIEIINIYKGF